MGQVAQPGDGHGRSRIIGALGFAGITLAVQAAKSMAVFGLIAWRSGPAGYGTWFQSATTVTLLAPLGGVLQVPLIRLLPERRSPRDRGRLFTLCLIAALGITIPVGVIVMASSCELAHVILRDIRDGCSVLRVTGVLVPLTAANTVVTAFLRAEQRMGWFAVVSVAQEILTLGAIGVLALRAVRFSIVDSLVATGIVLGLVTLVTLGKVTLETRGFGWDREWRDTARLGIPMIALHPVAWISKYGQNYVLAYFVGVRALGVYGAIAILRQPVVMLGRAVALVAAPWLSRVVVAHGRKAVGAAMGELVTYFVAVALPLGIGIALIGKTLLPIFVQDVTDWMFAVLAALLTASIMMGIYGITIEGTLLERRAGTFATMWVVIAVMQLAVTTPLVASIGIVGVAAGEIASSGVAIVWSGRRARRVFGLEVSRSQIARTASVCGVLGVVGSVGIWIPRGPASLLWAALVTVASVIAVWALLPDEIKEGELLRRYVGRFRSGSAPTEDGLIALRQELPEDGQGLAL